MFDYLDLALQLYPKITKEQKDLTPLSVMNVFLAAKVLGTSVSVILKDSAQSETARTVKHYEM